MAAVIGGHRSAPTFTATIGGFQRSSPWALPGFPNRPTGPIRCELLRGGMVARTTFRPGDDGNCPPPPSPPPFMGVLARLLGAEPDLDNAMACASELRIDMVIAMDKGVGAESKLLSPPGLPLANPLDAVDLAGSV